MLVARNISKRFGGVIALNQVNLELHPGKVNAIIGENGAGKSTLMKMILLMEHDIKSERFILCAGNHSYRDVFNNIAKEFGKKPPSKKVTPFLAKMRRALL